MTKTDIQHIEELCEEICKNGDEPPRISKRFQKKIVAELQAILNKGRFKWQMELQEETTGKSCHIG